MIKYTNKYTDKSFDIAKCRESAESGYAPAQYQLGQCYAAGRGVAEDYSHAVRWYSRAVDFGGNAFPEAQRGLADCYAAGHGVEQDWGKAVDLYRQAAKNDDPEAQFQLARCYAEGHGVEQDMTEVVRLYKKAATYVNENTRYYGHAGAMRCLAECYANGNGIRKNAKQAAAWNARADSAKG